MVIDEIEGIMIMVSDQQKALDFYTQKLGFVKKVDTDMAEFRWIVVGPMNSNTVMSLVDPTKLKGWPDSSVTDAEKKDCDSIWNLVFYKKH